MSKYPNFIQLSILSECSDNHDSILSDGFERDLFKDEFNVYESLRITYCLLLFGSEEVKILITQSVKHKILELTSEGYFEQLNNTILLLFDEQKRKMIKSIGEDIYAMQVVIEDQINEDDQLIEKKKKIFENATILDQNDQWNFVDHSPQQENSIKQQTADLDHVARQLSPLIKIQDTVGNFIYQSELIINHFTKPNSPQFVSPEGFQQLYDSLSQLNIDDIQRSIPTAQKLSEISFRPDFRPSQSDINDFFIPSLTGHSYVLMLLVGQIMDTLKRYKFRFQAFSSEKDPQNEKMKNQQHSALPYSKQTISLIQTHINASLTQFCSILPQLANDSSIQQLHLQRIKLLSSMTIAAEACQVYLEIQNSQQTNCQSADPIQASSAVSNFRGACVREILEPRNAGLKVDIYKELNSCMANVQNIAMLATF
ncbi:MAG: hypothetical protein EZS28_028134 [Streblomastix strix]|uniref:Uncharacterized protein n=1 Tax=Streblomastix strix TaxID=222440 RepID=A0A5J4V0T7_9EUKA|nr:MAG: hypothetical protein EZS28_028134 [Streblomastix strix]